MLKRYKILNNIIHKTFFFGRFLSAYSIKSGFCNVKNTFSVLILKLNAIIKTFHLCFWDIKYYPFIVLIPFIIRPVAVAYCMLGLEDEIGYIQNEEGAWILTDLRKYEEPHNIVEVTYKENVNTGNLERIPDKTRLEFKENYSSLYEEMNGPVDPNATCEEINLQDSDTSICDKVDSSDEEAPTIEDILQYDWNINEDVKDFLVILSSIENEYYGRDFFDKDYTEALDSLITDCIKMYYPSNIFLEMKDPNTFYRNILLDVEHIAKHTKNSTLINFVSIYNRDCILEHSMQKFGNPDIELAIETRVGTIDKLLKFKPDE